MILGARVTHGAAGADRATIPAIGSDGSLFPIGKLEAHRTGQKHLAVSVFVFSGDRLLIQQRAAGKYHCAGQWANTCCTHPHWGETPERCAARRLREELGVELPLVERAVLEYRAEVTDGLVEHERVHVFEGRLPEPTGLPRDFDRGEVQALRWIAIDALREEARRRPDRISPWLRIYLSRWAELSLRVAA